MALCLKSSSLYSICSKVSKTVPDVLVSWRSCYSSSLDLETDTETKPCALKTLFLQISSRCLYSYCGIPLLVLFVSFLMMDGNGCCYQFLVLSFLSRGTMTQGASILGMTGPCQHRPQSTCLPFKFDTLLSFSKLN